ncbi:MAG: hypothetical protein ABII13_05200 [Patescibacteria group bacterium]
MKSKNKKRDSELYTYTEFREKFFPQIEKRGNGDDYLTRESFLDFLKKISRPINRPIVPNQRVKETKET